MPSALKFLWLIYKLRFGQIKDIKEIEAKGLLTIKIAQHLALRSDFFKSQICMSLAQLFSQENPSRPKNISELMDEKERAFFRQVDERPFVCASVGQIHHAELLSGEKVVVKILKNDFESEFKADVLALDKFFSFLELTYPRFQKIFDPRAMLSYIQSYSLEELDLRKESEGQARLKSIQEKTKSSYDLSRLAFPKIYSQLSHKNILISSYIEGSSFRQLMLKNELAYDLLLELFKIHGFYLFCQGEFHGDLHPGNIISGKDSKFYFIDTASISKSSPLISTNLLKFFFELSEYNYFSAAHYIHEMAVTKLDESKLKKFKLDFSKLYANFKGKTVSELSLTKQMMETMKLAIISGMSFDHSLFPIIKSLSYLDGMVLNSNPKADLIKDMKKSIEGLLK